MQRFVRAWTFTWIAAAGCLAGATSACGADADNGAAQRIAASKSMDVALASGDVLQGQMLNGQSVPCRSAEISLLQSGRLVARTMTDDSGGFQFQGVRGGHYSLVAANKTTNLRVWGVGTAPPTAQPSVLVIDPQSVALGQGGGIFRALANPWVSAGAITAAVAVPIALSNNDSGS